MSKSKKQKQAIHHPHDKTLFSALKKHDVARDLLQHYLPKTLLEKADLKRINLYNTKLITPEFKAFEADVIYEVPLQKQKGLFFFHCELQSTVSKTIALRIWQYILLLLIEYHDNHKEQPLPLVYPIILYTGEKPYDKSTNFFDLFGEQKALAQEYLLSDVAVIDVCRLSDEDICKHRLLGLAEFAFKYKTTKNIEKFFDTLLPWLHEVEYHIDESYAIMLLKYVVDVFPAANYEIFAEKTNCYLSQALGDKAMTIAQQLRQQGRREGMQQGMQQGMRQGIQATKKEIAKQLLSQSVNLNVIQSATGLSMKEIRSLKEEFLLS